MSLWEKLNESADWIKKRCSIRPEIVVATGTGLGGIEGRIDEDMVLPFREIPHFISTSAPTHSGTLHLGYLNRKPVAVLNGRLHYYEGRTMQEVVHPIRTMGLLDARTVILTNVSGSVNPNFVKGEIIAIRDHINLMFDNPLRGSNEDRLGARFPDMSESYDPDFRKLAIKEARELGLELREGIYLALAGPSLETKAEYAFIRTAGADLVGMSTVPEVIAAKHMEMKVLAFSVVSNICHPAETIKEVTVQDVVETAWGSSTLLTDLICRIIAKM